MRGSFGIDVGPVAYGNGIDPVTEMTSLRIGGQGDALEVADAGFRRCSCRRLAGVAPASGGPRTARRRRSGVMPRLRNR